jgi:hypothetical protein
MFAYKNEVLLSATMVGSTFVPYFTLYFEQGEKVYSAATPDTYRKSLLRFKSAKREEHFDGTVNKLANKNSCCRPSSRYTEDTVTIFPLAGKNFHLYG